MMEGALLSALEFLARGALKLAEVVGAIVRQGVSLEPSPQVFDRVEVGRVRRQERNLDMPAQGVSRYSRTNRLRCAFNPSQITSKGYCKWTLSALRNSTTSSFLMLPSCNLNQQLVRVKPAITQTWLQLK